MHKYYSLALPVIHYIVPFCIFVLTFPILEMRRNSIRYTISTVFYETTSAPHAKFRFSCKQNSLYDYFKKKISYYYIIALLHIYEKVIGNQNSKNYVCGPLTIFPEIKYAPFSRAFSGAVCLNKTYSVFE